MTDACYYNSLNIDKNAKSIAELNDLMLGLSLQLTKIVSDNQTKNTNMGGSDNLHLSISGNPSEEGEIGRQSHHYFSSRLTKIAFP